MFRVRSWRIVTSIHNFFLGAKDWQVFLLFVVGILPLVFGNSLWPFALFSELYYFAWLWIAGSFLAALTTSALRLKLRFFRFSVLFLALYFLVAIAILPKFLRPQISLPGVTFNVLVALFITLIFLAMVSVLYVMYFVAKSLLLAETGRPVSALDYFGSFFLICFFLVGVWIIQPRINRLFIAHRERP